MVQRKRIQINGDPGEFVASIPAALRFIPSESVVVAGFTADPQVMEYAFRADLPQPHGTLSMVQDLCIFSSNQQVDFVNLLIISGTTPGSADLSHRDLMNKLMHELSGRDIPVAHALYVERIERGLPWRSYLDPNDTGHVGDPARSPIATGTPFYPSRDGLAAQLTRDPQPLLNRRGRLLRALPPVRPGPATALIRNTIDQIQTSPDDDLVLDDDTLVRLGHALTHHYIRDFSLGLAITKRAAPAEYLWALLTRTLPRFLIAYPASLLAVCAYLRGDGTLANIALDTALDANPDIVLGNITRNILNYPLRPEEFKKLLTEAAQLTPGVNEHAFDSEIEGKADPRGGAQFALSREPALPKHAWHQLFHIIADTVT